MRRAVVIPVVLALAWWAISMSRSLKPHSRAVEKNETALSELTPVTRQTASLAPVASTTKSPNEKPRSPQMAHPFEYQAELDSYVNLHSKVFLSDAEKKEKAALLRHAGLMKAMGKRLVEVTRDPGQMLEQDTAIDMLLEALHTGDQQAAAEVLRSVVQDAQIEDANIDHSSREQLAGLKAEVLYQWSATSPDIVPNLQAWLPGPVSKKIWDNVVKMQQANLAESREEARASH